MKKLRKVKKIKTTLRNLTNKYVWTNSYSPFFRKRDAENFAKHRGWKHYKVIPMREWDDKKAPLKYYYVEHYLYKYKKKKGKK